MSGQSDANGPAVGNGARVAEADGPGFYGVSGLAADDMLNISSEQTSHAANVGSIPLAPTCVRNLGCRGGLTFQEFGTLNQVEQPKRLQQNPRWCQVEYLGVAGWVAESIPSEASSQTDES